MRYVEATMVKACIALLVVEGVLGVNQASLKYGREANGVDNTCGVGTYDKKCCPEDEAAAELGCSCRCVEPKKDEQENLFCPANQGPSLAPFTTVSHRPAGEGESVGDGTASAAHIIRPNGLLPYMFWILIVVTFTFAKFIT